MIGAPFLFGVLGCGLAVAAVALRKTFARRVVLARSVTLGIVGVTAASGLTVLAWTAFAPSSYPGAGATDSTGPMASDEPAPPRGSYPDAPLVVGEAVPPLDARGWINGTPPTLDHGRGFVVLDVWAEWCPGCRRTAPGLVHAYKLYHDRGVSFISLTNMTETRARLFVDRFGIPWPSGYGAGKRTIAALGAFNTGQTVLGYEVRPTLYLIGKDGRVRWSDRQARMRHDAEDAQLLRELTEELEAAIEGALVTN